MFYLKKVPFSFCQLEEVVMDASESGLLHEENSQANKNDFYPFRPEKSVNKKIEHR